MTPERNSKLNRREFLLTNGVTMAAWTVVGTTAPARANAQRERLAMVGTEARGSTMWGHNLLQVCGDRVEIVGLCDINSKRKAASQKFIAKDSPKAETNATFLSSTGLRAERVFRQICKM
jgi:hypothetical protein